jgi:hypothetical protein
VLVSGTNAIIINATTTSDVVLRGLDIEGLGTGLVGIKVLGGLRSLHVEKCTINNFAGTNGSGIEIATTTAGTTQVYITDTILRRNGQGSGGGIRVNPGAAAAIVKASLDNVKMEHGIFGLKQEGASASNVSVQRSIAAGNSAAGFSAVTSGSQMNIERSVSTHNGTGVSCSAGTTVRIGNSSITDNTTAIAGTCSSFKNNDIDAVVGLTPINPQ